MQDNRLLGRFHCLKSKAKQFSLWCSAKYEDTILTVKKKVEVKMGVPVDKQLLFWHNKELTALYDNKTLLDLHLHTGFSLKGYNLVRPRHLLRQCDCCMLRILCLLPMFWRCSQDSQPSSN